MTSPLDQFRQVMTGPLPPEGVDDIAEHLSEQARQACRGYGLSNAEIYCGGGLVTFFLTERDAWEAVIVGPNAYQFYPGFVSSDGGAISWLNIWVTDNYNLDKFTAVLKEAFEQAAHTGH